MSGRIGRRAASLMKLTHRKTLEVPLSPFVHHGFRTANAFMRHSLTRMRYLGRGREHAKIINGSKDSPMCADNDAQYAECHSDTLQVGIADEVAYPKIVSRRRVVQSRRSIAHSTRLDESRNFSPRHKTLSSILGKWRPKVSGKSNF